MAATERLHRTSTIDDTHTVTTHEEKDELIETLRRRHIKYKEKVKLLKDSNEDFWKTIQQQQEVLENMEKKFDAQKVQFQKEQRELRARKNGEILKIKKMMMKERGLTSESEKTVDISKEQRTSLVIQEGTTDMPNIEELESLRRDNDRLEAQMESMAKEIDEMKKNNLAPKELRHTKPRKKQLEDEWTRMEEEYKQRLADKEEELRVVREELLVVNSPVAENNANAGGSKETEQLLDQLNEDGRKIISLNAEIDRLQNELHNQKDKLQADKLENERLETHLEEVREECNLLTMQVMANKTELNDVKREYEKQTTRAEKFEQSYISIKKELDKAMKEIIGKSKQVEESIQRQDQLKVKLVELGQKEEEARSMWQEKSERLRHEKAEFQKLLLRLAEERKAEVATLVLSHELEKKKFAAEIDSLRKEREWVVASKILNINSMAAELERLRKSQAC